jgi:hypothetical protein
MAQTPPIWWQPVMKDLKDRVDKMPVPHSSRKVLFEMLRKTTSECVQGDFAPKDMTEKQARYFVFELTLIMLDMLRSGEHGADEFAERFLSLTDSIEQESKVE